MDEDLWSVRNVAEYAYCPRLFYLMHVEGIFVPSPDTEKGVSIHHRVDKPSVFMGEKEVTEDHDRPKVIRRMALSSERLGITATLDLAEISGNDVVPIEYRKGKAKRIHHGREGKADSEDDVRKENLEAWPTDNVQVGLQSILLEEYGYTVREAVIYYAEEKLRLKIAVNDKLKEEALQILKAAKECAKGPRPLPLLNDPRCLRCSLQPVCLPDEVNYQKATKQGENGFSPRKIWPPRSEGIHVVAQQDGLKISISGSELIISNKDGEKIRHTPLVNVESLSLLGRVQITTQAICSLAERNIPIAFLSSGGRLITIIDPMDTVSADIRRAQVRIFDNPDKCLYFAKAIVSAKLANQRALLMRNYKTLPKKVSRIMADEIKRVKESHTIEEVRGHEGMAASLYFGNFHGMLKGPFAEEFRQNGRRRRPPPDPVNACLSIAYSILTSECIAALRIAGLEPSIGGYHVTRPGRPALALDLMEPFRPLIADSITITCFNKGELKKGHFHQTSEGCNLTSTGRRSFFEAYHRRMNTEVTHHFFKYRLSYRRMIILHARMLVAWMMGEIEDLSFLTTR